MRKSYGGELCTVRFTGRIPVWSQVAYGVEWDNPSRGKHNGDLDGHQYFTCRIEKAGSFLKATKAADPPVNFHEALMAKYTQRYEFNEVRLSQSKQIETVGMDKYFERHQNLENLGVISLDGCCIDSFSYEKVPDLRNLRQLDLSHNLFEDLGAALDFLSAFSLEKLDLRGNRFSKFETKAILPTVTDLNLGSTLITPNQLAMVLKAFPNLQRLGLSRNLYTEYPIDPKAIEWIDLAYNQIQYLKNGNSLVLTHNQVQELKSPIHCDYLNIYNQNTPTRLSIGEIDNLVVPDLCLSEAVYDRAAIIGRLASVVKLNGTLVTAEERRESELFLLSQIDKKLQPPLPPLREEYLRSIYGAPKPRSSNSICARLIQLRVAGNYYRIVGDAPVRRLKVLVSKKVGHRPICMTLEYNGRVLDDDEQVNQVCDDGESLDLNFDENKLYEIISAPPVVDERILNMPYTD